MGKRGQKVCGNPNCRMVTGPRTLRCKACNYDFNVNKGITKIAKGLHGKETDWKELERGNYIKVISGTGPSWKLQYEKEDGSTEENLGYHGLFQVSKIFNDGLLCYPRGKNPETGACFIYMGPEKQSKVGTMLRPHKVRKVDSKYVRE